MLKHQLYGTSVTLLLDTFSPSTNISYKSFDKHSTLLAINNRRCQQEHNRPFLQRPYQLHYQSCIIERTIALQSGHCTTVNWSRLLTTQTWEKSHSLYQKKWLAFDLISQKMILLCKTVVSPCLLFRNYRVGFTVVNDIMCMMK